MEELVDPEEEAAAADARGVPIAVLIPAVAQDLVCKAALAVKATGRLQMQCKVLLGPEAGALGKQGRQVQIVWRGMAVTGMRYRLLPSCRHWSLEEVLVH